MAEDGRDEPSPLLVAGLWLVVAASLAWLTHAVLLGQVEHRLDRAQIRGGTIALSILPAPTFPWPRRLRIGIFEDGRTLGPEVHGPRSVRRTGGGAFAAPMRRGAGLHRYTALYFTAGDGTEPARNGRSYTVRYPRRDLPASWALLLAGWVILPGAAIRIAKALPPGGRKRPAGPGIGGWSIFLGGCLYTLFALQAWLPPSNAGWLLAVAAAGLVPFLASLPVQRTSIPAWSAWCVGLLAWMLYTGFAGTPYASPARALRFVAVSAGGLMLYVAARGRLRDERRGPILIVVLFAAAACLSLARDAGFDPAGLLAARDLAALWPGGIENPWTAKFLAHWLLVCTWCGLAAVASQAKGRRRDGMLVAGLGALAIWANGSKSALLALVVSSVVASAALLHPRAVRRLVVGALALGVLSAPLLFAAPWRLRSMLPVHLTSGPLSALEMDVRGGVWEFSRRLVALHPVLGWGFGASASLPGRRLPIAEALAVEPGPSESMLSRHPSLAGGHPHNAALLTWLDLGAIGALFLAALLLAIERALARVEAPGRLHATLLGLLVVTATFLAFNYPAWEPEVASILWMTVALAATLLPRPDIGPPALRRHLGAVLLVLVAGGALLVGDRASRWLSLRALRTAEPVLQPAAGRLVVAGSPRDLAYGRLDTGAELVRSGGRTSVRGWAYGPPGFGRPRTVLVFSGPTLVAAGRPELPSSDLFARTDRRDVAALMSGFELPVDTSRFDPRAPVTVVALEGERAIAAELPLLSVGSPGPAPR